MYNSIYEKSFWLDATTIDGEWAESIVTQNGEVIARLPYVFVIRNGIRYIEMPLFTQTLGPFLKIDSKKNYKIISKEKELINKLINKLPEFDSFRMCFHWSFSNWMPFYWKGFKQTTRYTYQLRNIKKLEKVWEGFDQKVRTDIRKAEKILNIELDSDLEKFHDITSKTYERQGLKCPYSYESLMRLHKACVFNKCSQIYFAKDEENNYHSAIYIIWDNKTTYYLIGGSDPKFKNSGANSLLIWRAIEDSSKHTDTFDFEGSMMESVERFFRGFGGEPVPYFQLTYSSIKHKKYLKNNKLKNLIKRNLYFKK